jgi:hypothetical protein
MMDIYFKKYLKYKNKYLGLLNQQGGRHTIDQISMTKNGYIFDYDLNKYIEEPICLKHIHLSRAVLINNTIYDYLYLLNWIIISKDGIARDPINKEIISIDDLELMYRKLQKGNEKFIDDPEDQEEDQQLFEKTTREYNIIKEKIINNTTREYNKQNEKLMDSIRKKLFSMSNYGTTNYKTSLKNIDLIGLYNSLNTKEKLLDSLDYKIKDDILSNSYDSMFKILLLTKEQIIKLYSYHPIKFYKILDLTINQINKLLSFDDEKQELILKFDNNYNYINNILSIYDISLQDDILKYVSYKIISFLLDILEHTTIECVKKLVLLNIEELEILYNNDYTPLKIKELTALDLSDIKIKIWKSVNL